MERLSSEHSSLSHSPSFVGLSLGNSIIVEKVSRLLCFNEVGPSPSKCPIPTSASKRYVMVLILITIIHNMYNCTCKSGSLHTHTHKQIYSGVCIMNARRSLCSRFSVPLHHRLTTPVACWRGAQNGPRGEWTSQMHFRRAKLTPRSAFWVILLSDKSVPSRRCSRCSPWHIASRWRIIRQASSRQFESGASIYAHGGLTREHFQCGARGQLHQPFDLDLTHARARAHACGKRTCRGRHRR